MKTTKKHFELFKKWFKHYQDKFQLNEYRADFFHEKTGTSRAQIATNQMGKVTRVSFSTKWGEGKLDEEFIKITAMHECFHLLLSRLRWIAGCRFIGEEEITEEDERVVRKLENIFIKL